MYFDQLTFDKGKSSACHPAYQAVATFAKSRRPKSEASALPENEASRAFTLKAKIDSVKGNIAERIVGVKEERG